MAPTITKLSDIHHDDPGSWPTDVNTTRLEEMMLENRQVTNVRKYKWLFVSSSKYKSTHRDSNELFLKILLG